MENRPMGLALTASSWLSSSLKSDTSRERSVCVGCVNLQAREQTGRANRESINTSIPKHKKFHNLDKTLCKMHRTMRQADRQIEGPMGQAHKQIRHVSDAIKQPA